MVTSPQTSPHRRLLALCIVLALITVACGTSTTSTDSLSEAEERIAELEAELAAETASPDPTTDDAESPQTTSPPESRDTDNVAEAGTIEPLLDDTTTTTVPINTGGQYATPTGVTLQTAASVEQARDLMREMLGATDDVATKMARLGPFPAIPTLPDTVLTLVDTTLENDLGDSGDNNGFDYSARVEGTTSATREDAHLALITSIAAAGWELDSDREAGGYLSADFGDFDNGNIDVLVRTVDNGGAEFKINFTIFSDEARPELVANSLTWAGNGPFEQGILQSVQAQVWRGLDDFSLEAWHRFPGWTDDEVEGTVLARIDTSDWQVVETIIGIPQVQLGDAPGQARVNTTGNAQVFDYTSDR